MDWLDERLEKVKNAFFHMKLRKALAVYILICIVLVGLMSLLTLSFCDRWDIYIWSQYSDQAYETYEIELTNVVFLQDYSKLTRLDRALVEVIDFIQTWSTIFYSFCGIIAVSCLFYNHKMKQPLLLLKEATKKVGSNDLDIDVSYESKDEMGDLCRSFELMRNQLIENNQRMWDMMEEQKRLNAAFAHDLRTPLTILRGYTDFLKQYVPEGKVDERKLTSTLGLMAGQLDRLERFTNTMRDISSLEEIPIHPEDTDFPKLEHKLKEVILVMNGRDGIQIKLRMDKEKAPQNLLLDLAILMEVFENLLCNAMRYAKSMVEVTVTYHNEEEQLLLSVADDGRGFSAKDLTMATSAYYSNSSGDKTVHFGIGLYICKRLCEKHGGWITTANRLEQGAVVTVAFLNCP